jgi:hypothetical protein
MSIITLHFYDLVEGEEVPLSGVFCFFYDNSNNFLFAGISDDEGNIQVDLLPGSYACILSPDSAGCRDRLIKSPYKFEVRDEPHTYNIFLTKLSYPSTNPRICRCHGTFSVMFGNATLIITPEEMRATLFDLDILAYINKPIIEEIKHNKEITVDLLRNFKYSATIITENQKPITTTFVVPDLPEANLPDVIFPVPASVIFSPEELELNVGETKEVKIKTIYRSGTILETISDIDFEIDNPDVIEIVSKFYDNIVVKAKSIGSTKISTLRKTIWPEYQIIGEKYIKGEASITVI